MDLLIGEDKTTIEDEDGFTSFNLGIGIYAPKDESNTKVVESIILFREGYYNPVQSSSFET